MVIVLNLLIVLELVNAYFVFQALVNIDAWVQSINLISSACLEIQSLWKQLHVTESAVNQQIVQMLASVGFVLLAPVNIDA